MREAPTRLEQHGLVQIRRYRGYTVAGLSRGEIEEIIQNNLDYLATIRAHVERCVKNHEPPSALNAIDIESCGKSRIPLNGLVQELHHANLQALYHDLHVAYARQR